jgi:hypothetical protein
MVRGGSPGVPRRSAGGFGKKGIAKIVSDAELLRNMSVLKLPLLVDLQQKTGELVPSMTSCPSINISENTLDQCIGKCGYGNFNHRCNVSPIHLHALLAVGSLRRWITCV